MSLESREDARARLDTEGLTPSERALLWDRIATRAPRPRPRALPIVLGTGGLAAAALAAAVALFWIRGSEPDRCAPDPSATSFAHPTDCGHASVTVGRDAWRLAPGAQVERIDSGARVRAGTVAFEVETRHHDAFAVELPRGHRIIVVGTAFEVEASDAGGRVTVTEGVIHFVWNDGKREPVRAGETLRWPRPEERPPSPAPTVEEATPSPASGTPAPEPSAPSATPAPSASSQADLASVMDRVLQLKSQHRHAELISLLRRSRGRSDLSPVQRERLSYELGLALEGAGQDACAHWRRHLASYGSRRASIERRLEACPK